MRVMRFIPSPQERQALLEMAKQDVRAPNEQVRYLIVAEAIRRGLLHQVQDFNHETKNSAGVRQDTPSAIL